MRISYWSSDVCSSVLLAPPAGRSRGGFLLRCLFGRDDRPAWPERVEVRPSVPAARVEGARMVVTWVGHATMLIQTQGLNILTDPVWSDVAGPFGRIGPRRVAAPGVALDDLPPIEIGRPSGRARVCQYG